MSDRKYVIARTDVHRDVYGFSFNGADLVYLKGVSSGKERVRGFDEKGLQANYTPRIHKVCVSNPREATTFDEKDADFLCAVFNLVAERVDSRHAFFVRALDSLI